jgi:hypothetical protein
MPGSAQQIILPWVRIAILLTAVIVLCGVSFAINGAIIPQDAKHALIFQNALLLVVLGSAVIEHKFTKPADSLVNALMGLIT